LQRVKALYLVPYFDNPAGTNMSIERRRELIDVFHHWSARNGMMMLVDNAYRDLRYDGEDVPSMLELGADPRRTVETGTFSKNLSPGIRVGWGIAPEPLHTAIERRKSLTDFGSPHFCQTLVSGILAGGHFDAHLERLRKAYRAKRDAMIAACDEHLRPLPGVRFEVPRGGLYVWVELPSGVDAGPSGKLWQAALDAGVLYVPGEFSYPAEGHPVAGNTMRLSFGVQSEARIAEGIALLGRTLRRLGAGEEA
jgi:2-aminoadipate transaminase